MNHDPSSDSPATPRQTRSGERSYALDATRAVALFGVIVVNTPFFAGTPAGAPGMFDSFVAWLVQTFAAAKFFPVFSFLFGFGFARVLDRAVPGQEAVTRRRFFRRLAGLAVLGGVHAACFFHGDILLLYAVLGLGLWLTRDWSTRRLVAAGATLLVLGVVVQAEALRELDAYRREIEGLAPGAEVTRGAYGETLLFVLAFNGPVAAAMFLLGRAAGREGWFPPQGGWSRGRVRWLVIGGTLATLASGGAVVWARAAEEGSAPWLVYGLAAPVMALALLHGVFAMARRAGRATWVRVLGSTGRSTLSGYLAHSVILGTLFNAWGLDLFGRAGAAASLAVAAGVFAVIVVVLHVWERVDEQGPAERLLRWWVRRGEDGGQGGASGGSKGVVPGLAAVIGVSLTANQMTAVALPWLVLERTGRGMDAGLLAFCTGAALVLGGWLGGVLADRMGAGRIAFTSDVLGAVVNASIPLLGFFGVLSFPALVVLAAAGAMLDPAGVTARESLLPEAARAGGVSLEKANAWSEGAQGMAQVVGPALGGVLIAWLGAAPVLLITAGLFLITAVGGGWIARRIAAKAVGAGGGGGGWLAGWAALRSDRLLWAITLIGTVWMAALAPVSGIVLPVWFHEAGGAERLGCLLAAMGVGGLAGAWIYGAVLSGFAPRLILLLGLGVEVASLGFLGWAREPVWQLGAAGLTGLAGGVVMPLVNTVFQRRAPPGALGRVLGTSTSLAMAAAPLGFLAAGWLVEEIGPRATILACSGVLLATLVYAMLNGALRELDKVAGRGGSSPRG